MSLDERHLFPLGMAGRVTAKRGKGMSRDIHISTRTLIVLCGTAGAGKSTFARQHFKPTQVVSSDTCRALICDSECNQEIDPDTFDLFHFILQKRLKLGVKNTITSPKRGDMRQKRKMRVEDKFDRRRPMFLPIYHVQTCCRISIERLAMRKGSLICVPSLRRLCLPGASFKLGFMPVSPRSTAKLSFHFRHHGQTSFRILLC